MNIGDVIKWSEVFEDVGILKNSGFGIILDVFTQDNTKIYKVYKLIDCKTSFFYEDFLDKILDTTN